MATNASASEQSTAHTYHCLCSNFVLATAFDLRSAKRRALGDHALIVPILYSQLTSTDSPLEPLTILESTFKHSTAVMIEREDGYEKRWPVACNRCDLILGYYLDKMQFGEPEDAQDASAEGEENATKGLGTYGPKEDLIYILPGALVTTEEMKEGRKPPENELHLKM